MPWSSLLERVALRFLMSALKIKAHRHTLTHEGISFVVVGYGRTRLILFNYLRRLVIIDPMLPGGA